MSALALPPYLRKIRPRTRCLYSAASMLPGNVSAVAQSLASNPRLAAVSFFFSLAKVFPPLGFASRTRRCRRSISPARDAIELPYRSEAESPSFAGHELCGRVELTNYDRPLTEAPTKPDGRRAFDPEHEDASLGRPGRIATDSFTWVNRMPELTHGLFEILLLCFIFGGVDSHGGRIEGRDVCPHRMTRFAEKRVQR